MTLKLWEKNYILTMTLLLFLLFGSIFFIQQYSFQKNLDNCCENSFFNEYRQEYAISSFLNTAQENQKLNWYCQSLQKQGIYLRIQSQDLTLADSRPFSWTGNNKTEFQIVRNSNRVYACIANSYQDPTYGTVSVIYQEDISDFYESQKRQMALLLACAIVIALFLSVILYRVMKKIYAPINNIAHELRTPLTAIQGYSQYISLGNISTEDIAFAGRQIDLQAQHMNALIENLLIMGNLRDGEIHMKHVDVEEMIKELKSYFPFLSIEHQTNHLYGDNTLLLSLLRNLVLNTSRHGMDIHILIQKNTIRIYNKEDYIEEEMLNILNKGRSIPKEKIHGKGLGVPLCREIIKKHHGKLQYQNLPGNGVEICAILWCSYQNSSSD